MNTRVAFFALSGSNGCRPGDPDINLLVRRGRYLGFPGNTIVNGEDIVECARRSLGTNCIVKHEGMCERINVREGEWHGKPAIIELYLLTGWKAEFPTHPDARALVIDTSVNDPCLEFDVTVLMLREAEVAALRPCRAAA